MIRLVPSFFPLCVQCVCVLSDDGVPATGDAPVGAGTSGAYRRCQSLAVQCLWIGKFGVVGSDNIFEFFAPFQAKFGCLFEI